jgi:hypothetical protein
MSRTSRDEAVATLREGHGRVTGLLDQLSEDDVIRPATIGGGEWSAKDLLAHLTTWEEAALQALSEWREGQRPTIETEAFASDEGVDRFNAATVEAKAKVPPVEIRAEAERVWVALVHEIETMSDEEWSAPAPYETERRRHLVELLGSILGAPKRPFGHAFAHLPDLEDFVGSVGGAGEEP